MLGCSRYEPKLYQLGEVVAGGTKELNSIEDNLVGAVISTLTFPFVAILTVALLLRPLRIGPFLWPVATFGAISKRGEGSVDAFSDAAKVVTGYS